MVRVCQLSGCEEEEEGEGSEEGVRRRGSEEWEKGSEEGVRRGSEEWEKGSEEGE